MSITTGSFPKALQGGKPKRKRRASPKKKLKAAKVSKNGKKPETMLDKLLKGTL